MTNSNELTFAVSELPYSLDPLEYDAYIHHLTNRSLFSCLTSEYKLGEVSGEVAESWGHNLDKTKWTFKLKHNLKFSNGDDLTPEIVGKSLTRAAYIMKTKDSRSSLLENLIDLESLNNASAKFNGIRWDDHNLYLSFRNPQEQVPLRLSFGLYAIIHPNNYSSINGEWISNSIVFSGPYKVEKWDDLNFKIRLWDNKRLTLKRPIEAVRFFKYTNQAQLASADLVSGSSESLAFDSGYKFIGALGDTIRYVQCSTWNDPKSLCHNKEYRKFFRKKFYDYIEKNHKKIVRSFFPLSINGIKELQDPHIDSLKLTKDHRKDFYALEIPNSIKTSENKNIQTYQDLYLNFVSNYAKENNLSLHFTEKPEMATPYENLFSYDIGLYFTGILIENPVFDVKFMFLSKYGIQLPDQDGKIGSLLKGPDSNVDIQKINELIWDQAIVWPVNHLSLGFWVKDPTKYDFEMLNTAIPPIDFQWLGLK